MRFCITPLRNRVIVEMAESRSDIIHVGFDIKHWKDSKEQLSNRGTVVAVGHGKRHPKTGTVMPPAAQVGDKIKFSELQYPHRVIDGKKYALIMDEDIVGIEK